MFVQSVLSIVVGVALLALLGSADVEDSGGLGLLLGGSLVLSVVLLGCAVTLPSGRRSVWLTTLVIEGINIASFLVGLVFLLVDGDSPPPAGALPFVLTALVVGPLVRPEVRAWFAGERTLA